MISVVVPVRNRDSGRLRTCLLSLRESSKELFEGIVSDYGSAADFSEQYEAVCRETGFQLVRAESQGLPWSRSWALNLGVRHSSGRFVVSSDADAEYASDPLEYCLKNFEPKRFFHLDVLFLPENMDHHAARPGERAHLGLFQFIEREAFNELKGYDERMMFWGWEDIDWCGRLQSTGYKLSWLPEEYKVYHLWHSKETADSYRPRTSVFDTMRAMLQNIDQPRIEQEWGYKLGLEDRPILKVLGQPGIAEVVVPEGSLRSQWPEIIPILKKEKVIHLVLGPRRIKRKLSFLAGPLQTIFGGLMNKSGLSVTEQLNDNYDLFYASLPTLQRIYSLIDYYLDSDMSGVWLMCGDSTQFPAICHIIHSPPC